jgi:hypothetical protein
MRISVQTREAPWRVEQQKQQQERQERRQRRQQNRFRPLRKQQGGAAAAVADAAAGSSVIWRQRALGGTVSVPVGRLRAQRPVRLTNHLGSKARSSSSSSTVAAVDSSTDVGTSSNAEQ